MRLTLICPLKTTNNSTGASAGIGKATAEHFAAVGANLVRSHYTILVKGIALTLRSLI